MLWQTAVIAKNSLYTGLLRPVGSSTSRNIVELLTALPPVPAPVEFPSESYPPLFARRLTPDPVFVALQVRISACTASVLFIGESIHNFYGKRLVELPTPLSRATSIRVTYRSLRQGLSYPPEMNGGAMSVCIVVFGRRLFISSRVSNITTDPTMIILRPGRSVEFRLPSSFRSSLGGLRALSCRIARFSSPDITLGVTDDYDLGNPMVDFRAPWTGFLSFGTDRASPLFVRASAVELIFCQRMRMSTIGHLPPILYFPYSSVIGPEELFELICLPCTEWLGVFLLKDELGQTTYDSNLFEFQRDVEEKGFAYHFKLEDKTLLVWCMELGPVGSGYNFVFCFIPHDRRVMGRGASRAVPNGASTPQHRVIPSQETTHERHVLGFLERIERNIDEPSSTVPIPWTGSNGTHVNRPLSIRRREQNSRPHATRARVGSSSRAPSNNGSARTNGAGLVAGNTSSMAREGTQTGLMTHTQIPTRTNANNVGLRGLMTPSTEALNNSNILSTAGSYAEQAGRSTDPMRENSSTSGQVMQLSNLQPIDQNIRRTQPTNGEGFGQRNQAGSSTDLPRANNQPSSQAIQRNSVQSICQNPLMIQTTNEQGARQTMLSPNNKEIGQNGKRARPSEGPVTSRQMQPPPARPRIQNPMLMRYRSWQAAARLHTQYSALRRARGTALTRTPSEGRAPVHTTQPGTTQAAIPNQMLTEPSSGLAARRGSAVRERVNEQAAGQTMRPSSIPAAQETIPLSSMERAVQETHPSSIHITYSTEVSLEPCPQPIRNRIPRRGTYMRRVRNPISPTLMEARWVRQESYPDFRQFETRPGGVDPYFTETTRWRMPERAQYSDRITERRRERFFGAQFYGTEQILPQPYRSSPRNSEHTSRQARIRRDLGDELLAENYHSYGIYAPSGAYAPAVDSSGPVELVPILEELKQRPGASAEWQILYDEAPSRCPNELWRAVPLFPYGPFVGKLPWDFVYDLFRECGGRDFDGRGFRFCYDRKVFMVFCRE